jgi:uncharacterized protein
VSDGPTQKPAPVAIDHAELSPDALRNVIHDLVTRDGTDYGAVEKTTEQKAEALLRQITHGEAQLVFDPETETLGLMTSHEWKRQQRTLQTQSVEKLHESQHDTGDES